MGTYRYRCTEQQLDEHLQRIAEAGDTVEHVVFKGGRDYVLFCREQQEPLPVRIVWDDEMTQQIAEAIRRGAQAANSLGQRIRDGLR